MMTESDALELKTFQYPVSALCSPLHPSPGNKGSSVWVPLFEAAVECHPPERVESLANDDSTSSPESPRLATFVANRLKRNRDLQSCDYIKVDESRNFLKSKRNTDKLSAILRLVLVHLPPIRVTLALLSLYIAKVRWDHPAAEALNALQLAAKIHETLIIVSLGSILKYWINHSLLIKHNGLPLGFLSSALHLGAPFSYLTSRELWAPILHTTGSERLIGIIIVLTTILCVVMSPLSAITMLPRQGWWKNEAYVSARSNLTYVSGSLYNVQLDAEAVPDHNYTWTPEDHSRASQDALLQSITTQEDYTVWFEDYPSMNRTYTNYEARNRPVSCSTIDGVVVATCPLSAVAGGLTDIRGIWGLPSQELIIKAEDKGADSSKPRKWKQPLVAIECSESLLQNGSTTAEFDSTLAIAINASLQINTTQYPVLMDIINNVHNSGGPLGYTLLNLKDSMALPISNGIIFVTALSEIDTDDGVVQLQPPIISLNLCLVSARWVQADTWIELSRPGDTLSHLNFSSQQALTSITDAIGTSNFVQIHEDWLLGIASLPNTSSNRSSYGEILYLCTNNRGVVGFCLDKFLAMHLVDAMAESGEFHDTNDETGYHVDKQKDGVVLFTPYACTYAYEFGSSRGVPFAFCVLLLHIIIVLVHIVMVFVSGHLLLDSGWESFVDLMMLALCSEVPGGLDTPGVAASQKWMKSAAVREAGDGQKVLIVFKNAEGRMEQPAERAEGRMNEVLG